MVHTIVSTSLLKADQLTHPVHHNLVNSHQHYLVSILALIIVCLSVIVGLLFVDGRRFRNYLRSDLRQGKQAIRQLEEDVAHLRQLAITRPIQQVQRFEPRVCRQAPLFPPTAPARSSNALNPTPSFPVATSTSTLEQDTSPLPFATRQGYPKTWHCCLPSLNHFPLFTNGPATLTFKFIARMHFF
jgi:hypothetical protein